VDTVENLIIDLLEWIGPAPRPYADVLEVWQTSCPRLPVWEDAVERGYVAIGFEPARGRTVLVSPLGESLLAEHGRSWAAATAPGRA